MAMWRFVPGASVEGPLDATCRKPTVIALKIKYTHCTGFFYSLRTAPFLFTPPAKLIKSDDNPKRKPKGQLRWQHQLSTILDDNLYDNPDDNTSWQPTQIDNLGHNTEITALEGEQQQIGLISSKV
jgi:hypothetical protein